MVEDNPFRSPEAFQSCPTRYESEFRSANGLGRFHYICICILLAVCQAGVVISILGRILRTTPAIVCITLLLLTILAMISFFTASAYRLKNIGWSPWVSAWLLIPGLQWIVLLALFCLPKNYAYTKKTDSSGICLGIFLIAFPAMISFIIHA